MDNRTRRKQPGLRFLHVHLLIILVAFTCSVIAEDSFSNRRSYSTPNNKNNNNCALVIPTSARYKRSNNETKIVKRYAINNEYNNDYMCITYDDINEAFMEVRQKIPVQFPRGKEWTGFLIDPTGQIVVEVSRMLAKKYALTNDVIVHGLPLIDTSKTMISSICPNFLRPFRCKPERYRTYTGICNNLEHPQWGATLTALVRLLPPVYPNGIDTPRVGVDGHDLPNPRLISAHLHQDSGAHDHAGTIWMVGWGQMVDHDLALAVSSTWDGVEEPICCPAGTSMRLTRSMSSAGAVAANQNGQLHPNCAPIEIPIGDPFYSMFNQQCLEFARSAAGQRNGCTLGPRPQMNTLSGILDANFIYGSHNDFGTSLRSMQGGLMRTLPAFRKYGLKDLLPLKFENPDEQCIRPNNDVYCFDAGDIRVNEQIMLTVLHTVLVREHNRVASQLGQVNPHWDDEMVYQETRHIMIAIAQHITFNEFLPLLLGKDMIQKYELTLLKEGYYDGYDPKINPGISSSFLTAAFRFGHSLLPTNIERWNKFHKFVGSQRLSTTLRQPFDLYKGGWVDQYVLGFANEIAQAMDSAVTQEVTNHLFQHPTEKFGMDLAALNLARAREYGVAGYNDFREYCGIGRARSFYDLLGTMPNDTVRRYMEIYRHVDDIDLWSAGVSERPLPTSMIGPTFACIISTQFRNLRRGDRFWYENAGWPSSFTPEQLQEIRKVTLSRLLCDNTDDVETLQVHPMVLADPNINPRVACKSGVLPRVDFTKWRDVSYQGYKK